MNEKIIKFLKILILNEDLPLKTREETLNFLLELLKENKEE